MFAVRYKEIGIRVKIKHLQGTGPEILKRENLFQYNQRYSYKYTGIASGQVKNI